MRDKTQIASIKLNCKHRCNAKALSVCRCVTRILMMEILSFRMWANGIKWNALYVDRRQPHWTLIVTRLIIMNMLIKSHHWNWHLNFWTIVMKKTQGNPPKIKRCVSFENKFHFCSLSHGRHKRFGNKLTQFTFIFIFHFWLKFENEIAIHSEVNGCARCTHPSGCEFRPNGMQMKFAKHKI